MLDREVLHHLYYHERLSMMQIAARLGCTHGTVEYWMRRYDFGRRDRSEATYAYRNPNGDPFHISEPQSAEEHQLFGVGLGLYMGEGTKSGSEVRLANSDPAIHRTFLRFLQHFCGVSAKQVRADLNIFDDRSVDHAIAWWCQQLGLSDTQFSAPIVRKSKPGSYTRKSQFGTLTLAFANVRLKKQILAWCDDFLNDIGP